MAFTWVTNAHGPSSQPTACRPPTCSLTSSVKSGVPPFPSCRPGFKSQAHYIRFNQFRLICVMWKSENKQKEAGIDPFLSKKVGEILFSLPDPASNAHQADLKVTVAEVLKVEIDCDGFCLLALWRLVRRHVRHLRWHRAKVHSFKPKKLSLI